MRGIFAPSTLRPRGSGAAAPRGGARSMGRAVGVVHKTAIPFLALSLFCAGCAPALAPSRPASAHAAAPGAGVQAAGIQAAVHRPSASGQPSASTIVPAGPATLPVGALYLNPATGRKERIVAAIAVTAVLIGDSQSEGAAGVPTRDTWTNMGLAKLGYSVVFCGRGGTGFVAANGPIGNYPDALEKGNWNVPYGPAPLVVIEGGGNDAARGATDDQILANASRLVKDLRQTYPTSRFVMIGTLAKGAMHGGGRRTQVDSLLGAFAEKNSIPFISAGDWLTAYSLTNKMADGVHLTKAGHRTLAEVLAGKLTALGVAAP